MKFALLGAEPDILPLIAAIRDSTQHTLAAAYEIPSVPGLDLRTFGITESQDGWESLLLGSLADAVIVCRGQDAERRADQLRKLTQAAIPLVVVHPVGEAILAFELQMIQRDSGGLIVPYQPDLDHPAFDALGDNSTDSGEIPVRQISVERRMADTMEASVRQQFARDALILRRLVGRVSQLSALGASQESSDYANLAVQMSAENGSIARWVVLPTGEGTASQWKVHTSAGTTTASQQENGEWAIVAPNSATDRAKDAASNVASITLDRIAGLHEGRSMPGADWEDACRAVELLENVDISRRRGKTVQLHYEDISEDNTFMSLMTAAGCLILILLVVLLPTLAAIETLLRPAASRSETVVAGQDSDQTQPSASSPFLRTESTKAQERSWFGIWPWLLFGFLALFLCLQFLRLATRTAQPPAKQNSPPAPPE